MALVVHKKRKKDEKELDKTAKKKKHMTYHSSPIVDCCVVSFLMLTKTRVSGMC